MAKSKALIQAEKTIAALLAKADESLRVTGQLKDQQAELQRQLNASHKTVARWCEKYKRKANRYADVKLKMERFAQLYMDLVLTFAAAAVRSSKAAAIGPFNCAGIVDYDPERIFEHFAKNIPGIAHWHPEQSEESSETVTAD